MVAAFCSADIGAAGTWQGHTRCSKGCRWSDKWWVRSESNQRPCSAKALWSSQRSTSWQDRAYRKPPRWRSANYWCMRPARESSTRPGPSWTDRWVAWQRLPRRCFLHCWRRSLWRIGCAVRGRPVGATRRFCRSDCALDRRVESCTSVRPWPDLEGLDGLGLHPAYCLPLWIALLSTASVHPRKTLDWHHLLAGTRLARSATVLSLHLAFHH